MSWVDDAAKTLGQGVSPSELTRLLDSIERAPRGDLAVDAWPFYGRGALEAAAEAGRRAIYQHVMTTRRGEHDRVAVAGLNAALKAIAKFEGHWDLAFGLNDSAANLRSEIERILAHKPKARTRGRPADPPERAMALAASTIWARAERRRVPLAGTKPDAHGKAHDLDVFLAAVSKDLGLSRPLTGALLRSAAQK